MEYQKSVIELIKTRRSCRTFEESGPDGALLEKLEGYLAETSADAGIKVRFVLLRGNGGMSGKLGTYGFIAGAPAYIAGILDREGLDAARFGFLFEKIILFATDLGLGTCWLGGTFRREDFARRLDLGADETLPILSPVGMAKGRPRMFETAMRAAIGANGRKPAGELFFDGSASTPLDGKNAGEYTVPLEMVRLAPSASNKQPWRVLREDGLYHFFLYRARGYGSLAAYDMQMNDIGIAMCHFELSARELGLAGGWITAKPAILPDGWAYVTTWKER